MVLLHNKKQRIQSENPDFLYKSKKVKKSRKSLKKYLTNRVPGGNICKLSARNATSERNRPDDSSEKVLKSLKKVLDKTKTLC